ncbi:MAG: aminopeptidase P family protein, partial [Phaeodactylibacter sp.]|nr:aminopeptidase P family protein [Phaeodactylibacter sp.]
AGTAVITQDHAGLWTDSRYFIQAEQELADSEVVLHRLQVPHTAEHLDWLLEHLPAESNIAMDGQQASMQQLRGLQRTLRGGDFLYNFYNQVISASWLDRPALPQRPVFELPVEFAGKSRAQKFAALRSTLMGNGDDAILISALDEIAWLFNLRGSDVPCNPVFYAYAYLDQGKAVLFVHKNKLDQELIDDLKRENILLKEYDDIYTFVQNELDDNQILVDPRSTNYNLYTLLPPNQVRDDDSPIQLSKTIKNATEIAQIRKAMLKDGVALTQLYRWIEASLDAGMSITEAEVAEQLDAFRRQQLNYHGESFSAIVGYQGNGAIVHYHPDPERSATLKPEGILLIDSGGQYLEGTTDITRTTALGSPTSKQKEHYTLVLKGHIQLDQAVFPAGTTGVQLDILARKALWQSQLNYGHGTGHGVGHFLNVHEGPQAFTPAVHSEKGTTAFLEGMLTSNEPGLYLEGQYGIRIENLILCIAAGKSPFGNFLKFEALTL